MHLIHRATIFMHPKLKKHAPKNAPIFAKYAPKHALKKLVRNSIIFEHSVVPIYNQVLFQVLNCESHSLERLNLSHA